MSKEVKIIEGACLADRVQRRYLLDIVNLSFGKLVKVLDDFHDHNKTLSKKDVQALITENNSIIEEVK